MAKLARTITKAEAPAVASPGPRSIVPVLAPSGRLKLQSAEGAAELSPEQAARLYREFARGSGHGLLSLGLDDVGSPLPPSLAYWRQLATRYMAAVCALPDIADSMVKPAVPPLPDAEFATIAAAVPPMLGAEYVSGAVLGLLWQDIDSALEDELGHSGLPFGTFLKSRSPAWNLVGRVHFNLAENRKDEEAPFAFLATYTTQLSSAGKAQHLPLGKALQEYAQDKERLLALLKPVDRATEHCPWLKAMVVAGEIFHPLRWTPRQAVQFLKEVPALESAGIVVRMPGSWRMNRPARPQVKSTVGGRAPGKLGTGALLDFEMQVTLDGETLSAAEIKQLLAHTDGLALIRGKW